MKFKLYPDVEGRWRWQLKSSNGLVVQASHQSFSTKSNAKRNARHGAWQMVRALFKRIDEA